MSFFNRRRGEFGASPVPNEQPNLTNYDERTVFSADGMTAVNQPMPASAPTPTPSAATTAVFDTPPVAPPVETERPMVFASKAHSGIYIYEYSDRLEYYVKTATYMHKFDVVYKNK